MDQGNSFERAGTRLQMGFQGAMWPWQGMGRGMMTIPLDVCEFSNEFIVRAMVPGIAPDAFEVSAQQNTLTLKGEFSSPDWMQQTQAGTQSGAGSQGPTCWIQENPVGKFARTVTLPFPVDADRAQASFDNGILTLHLPKAQSATMKKIPVQAGSAKGIPYRNP